jgi:hypothetical protein
MDNQSKEDDLSLFREGVEAFRSCHSRIYFEFKFILYFDLASFSRRLWVPPISPSQTLDDNHGLDMHTEYPRRATMCKCRTARRHCTVLNLARVFRAG